MNPIYDILAKLSAVSENLSPQQRAVKQLPALFQPPMTSPQLSSSQPGVNATRGELVGESTDSTNPMADAVLRRIANRHPEWLMRYGLDAVKEAAEAVTAHESDWGEIGSSDVSAYVQRVEDYLREWNTQDQAVDPATEDPEAALPESAAASVSENSKHPAYRNLRAIQQAALDGHDAEIYFGGADDPTRIEYPLARHLASLYRARAGTPAAGQFLASLTDARRFDQLTYQYRDILDRARPMRESLRSDEYHVAQVTLDDGKQQRVRINTDEDFRAAIERHFARQGRQVTDIKVDWGVHQDLGEDAVRRSIPWSVWNAKSAAEQQSLKNRYPNLTITDQPKKAGLRRSGPKTAGLRRSGQEKIDYAEVAQKINEILGKTFPDVDPGDWLASYMRSRWGLEGDIGQHLDRAARRHLDARNYHDYLAQYWDQAANDNALDGVTRDNNPWRVSEGVENRSENKEFSPEVQDQTCPQCGNEDEDLCYNRGTGMYYCHDCWYRHEDKWENIDKQKMSEQGVAEVSKEKTQGIALSKAYKKDFDDKKPGQGRAETALTGTYSKTGKPGGELKKQGVAEGSERPEPLSIRIYDKIEELKEKLKNAKDPNERIF